MSREERIESCIKRYNKMFCDDKVKKPTVDVMRDISSDYFGSETLADIYYKVSSGPGIRHYDNITDEELKNFECALDDLEARYGK